jgi:hypothetical protein
VFRLANGFLRVRQPVITAPEWFYPAFYGVLIVLLGGLLAVRAGSARASLADRIDLPARPQ